MYKIIFFFHPVKFYVKFIKEKLWNIQFFRIFIKEMFIKLSNVNFVVNNILLKIHFWLLHYRFQIFKYENNKKEKFFFLKIKKFNLIFIFFDERT